MWSLFCIILPLVAAVEITDWTLAAHGATRSLYKGTTAPWTVMYPVPNISLPQYKAVVNSPDGRGGMIQRAEDGRIHVQLVGPIQTQRRNGFGPRASRTPPYVAELDGDTGRIVKVYDLRAYGHFFSHPLRYTPDGHVIVTLFDDRNSYTSNNHTIVILDKDSTKVIWAWKVPTAAELVEVANSQPKSLIFANSQNIGSLLFTNSSAVPDTRTLIISKITSTIIFGADGATLYNDGLGGRSNEPTGIYRISKLPITETSTRQRVVADCYTFPWIVSLDTQGNIYSVCYMGRPNGQNPDLVSKFNSDGKLLWRAYQLTAEYLTLNDDETIIFAGNAVETRAYSTATGKMLWMTSPEAMKQGNELQLECFWGANPWVPRHPIPLSSGKIAFLCSASANSYDIRLVDEMTGKVTDEPTPLPVIPSGVAIFADSMDNVYAFGYPKTPGSANLMFARVFTSEN